MLAKAFNRLIFGSLCRRLCEFDFFSREKVLAENCFLGYKDRVQTKIEGIYRPFARAGSFKFLKCKENLF